MRFFGQYVRLVKPVLQTGTALLLLATAASPAVGQNALFVIPYTASTFAGPHALYTAGQACGDGVGIALDQAGDGCNAAVVSIGVDPHDIVVDPLGNVYWQDNTGSAGYLHKISPVSRIQTMYAGSYINSKPCASGNGDKYGDGCVATDGLANATSSLFTAKFNASRGLGVAPNGDVMIAGYNNSYDHRVSASTGLLTAVLGTGTSGYVDAIASKGTVNGSRGITQDVNGNVYVADTANNALRVVYSGFGTIPPAYQYVSNGAGSTAPVTPVAGQSYSITAPNTAGTKAVDTGVPAINAVISGPEDVEVDSNGNIYIADFGNAIVRAIYMGRGRLPGIAAPVTGYIYTVAGCNALNCVSVPYPKDGTSPVAVATSTTISDRKISLDKYNNLYIADASNNVIWFVDNATGGIRLLMGNFGAVAGSPAIGCASQSNTLGDGCPGPKASIYTSLASNGGFGITPDNQGNLYISDNEGQANAAGSRLRKLLSGLNFPTLTVGGTAVTQTVQIHFGLSDTPAATAGFNLTGTDFKLGTPACTLNADNTTDCLLPITFAPTQPGNDQATLTVTPVTGVTASFELTGYGNAPAVAFDPGSMSLASSGVSNPQGLAVDSAGNTYIADTSNNRILLQAAGTGAITLFAGTGTSGYTGDNGAATLATLKAPRAIAIDTTGSVFIADTGNNVIRKVDVTGRITTYAGGASSVCGTASDAFGDNCPALQTTFAAPSGLAADNLGQIYVSDTGHNLIRQISVSSNVSILAGGATASTTCTNRTDTQGDGCSASATIFSGPTALAYDATGQNLFVADTGNNIVRKIYLANTFNVTSATSYSVLFNPVTLVAGNGQAGSSIDSGSSARLSQLSGPTGVAVDPAGNAYIADTGNQAVRLVTANTGLISTVAGILATTGSTAVPAAATATQLNAPSAVAVTSLGTITIADSANNRILVDSRTQLSYNFGRVNVGSTSSPQSFTEVNVGTTPAAIPAFAGTGDTTRFALTAAANSNGTIAACGSTLAPGTVCNYNAVFTPAAPQNYSATYTQTGTGTPGAVPSITLQGLGAVLTPTVSSVAQTVPASGNAQFGSSSTLTATVTAACNTAAPSCFPSGTVSIVVDGTAGSPIPLSATATASQQQQGLSVGSHTVSCRYSGDDFYAAGSCANLTIIVDKASTTASLTALPNNQTQFPVTSCFILTQPPALKGDTQCTATTLTATVKSNTTGVPTGTVTFLASGGSLGSTSVAIGSSALNSTTGTATVALTYTFDPNRILATDPSTGLILNSTLPPGTYNITCTYSGASNFATSTCGATTLVILPQPADFGLVARGCAVTALSIPGTLLTGEGVACNPGPENFQGTTPLVTVAQGSTTDATIFINSNNTVAGTYTFSCTGLPANSTCTFAPTSITVTASSGLSLPQAVDMTLWTDLQPGFATSSLRTPASTTALAWMLGWPVTLLGLAGIVRFRRRAGARGLTLVALLLLMAGSSVVFTGCGAGGPGTYKPVLTPAGNYPITVNVKGPSGTHSTTVYWTVTSPGITGQQ